MTPATDTTEAEVRRLLHDVTTRERGWRAEQEFAANAAHELRNPIAAISGSLEVLQGGAKDVPDDRDRFLGHIERETARLGRLVAALLLLARIQTGQERPSLRLVELCPLLEDVAGQLEPQPGVTIAVNCPTRVAVLADEQLIRQAILNVAANAANHTSAGEITIDGRDVGAFAEIEVRDTGGGIGPDEAPHVFGRFYRSRGRIPGTGFGLGLPIARAIARELGGNITLTSELGAGTCVRIHVPSAKVVA